jgi:integrase
MADFRTRRAAQLADPPAVSVSGDQLADVATLQRRAGASCEPNDETELFHETIAEYMWARDVAGLTPATLQNAVRPVLEVCGHYYGCVPWRLTSRRLDQYFAGPGKRGHATMRKKIADVDRYFAFLEQRYGGEIARRFGVSVESPVDAFNRPRHRGDFSLRIPPSRRALAEFFGVWRAELPRARKYPVAARDYVMAKIAYLSGVRASELCSVGMGDVHWERGQWGRFVVAGKGARGSGPRDREAFLFEEGRELLWWYVEQVRGEFADDPDDPSAPLWPSERLPKSVAALNIAVAPPIVPETFRRTLKSASRRYLTGPVHELYPHLLRHACATHNDQSGMPLWDVQKLLGHEWATTTIGYLASVTADPERAILASSQRAVRRLAPEN